MSTCKTFRIPKLGSEVSPQCGFLGTADPIATISCEEVELFVPWLSLASVAPSLLVERQFYVSANQLPVFKGNLSRFSVPLLWRVYVSVSFLVQTYIWGDRGFPKVPRTTLPAGLAVIAHRLAVRLGVRPLLVYASYALKNWRRIDTNKPISADNVTMLVHFNPSSEVERYCAEDWFVAIHVDIEHEARRLLCAMEEAEDSRMRGEKVELTLWLQDMSDSLARMRHTLSRMSERCGPDVYYQFVRPYLAGFTKLLVPSGVVYEGVNAYSGLPQHFDGQTGAQSSIMPALDRFLGIQHHSPDLSSHLGRMLNHHTPREHRRYVLAWAKRERFTDKALQWKNLEKDSSILEALQLVRYHAAMFRREHYILAITHIARPAHRMLGETNPVGTGGSKLIQSLMLHLEETLHPTERAVRMKEFREHFGQLLGRPV